MKYSLGESLADYGFNFFEKLHHPLFLFRRNGTLQKVNEAGRKLIHVAHLGGVDVDELGKSVAIFDLRPHEVKYLRLENGGHSVKMIANQLGSSDFVLVELSH